MAARPIDPCARSFVVFEPCPVWARELSDVQELLDRHAERLVATLPGDWTVEGPLYEADALRMCLDRTLRDHDEQIELHVELSYPVAPGLERPPAELRFEVYLCEERHRTTPPDAGDDRRALLLSAAILGAAAGVGLMVHRRGGGSGWAVVAGLLTSLLLLVAVIVAQSLLYRARAAKAPPPQPTVELAAMVAAVERDLRTAFTTVEPGDA